VSTALWLILFVVATIPIAARLKRGEPQILYTWPWERLIDFIHRAAYHVNWRRYGDMALTLVVGPLLAWRVIRYRRDSLLFFFGYVSFLFFVLPAIGGDSLPQASLLSAAFVTLFGFGGYALALIGITAYSIVLGYAAGIHPQPGIGPALPGVSVGGFTIPLVEGIVALVIALLVHEGAHGVVAVRENIPVRHGGIITLGLLPIGAYVEPDDRIFRKAPVLSRLRVYAAGPVANMLVFAIFAAMLVMLAPAAQYLQAYECAHGAGVRIIQVPQTLSVGEEYIRSSAYGILQGGDVVLEVNGRDVNCVYAFMDVLQPYREAESNAQVPLVVERDGNVFSVSIQLNRGYLGVKGVETVYRSSLPLWYHILAFILSLIHWIAFLNFMIGLVNMLPIPPLDGGYIYRDLFAELGIRRVYRVLFWTTIAILLLNVLPWFV